MHHHCLPCGSDVMPSRLVCRDGPLGDSDRSTAVVRGVLVEPTGASTSSGGVITMASATDVVGIVGEVMPLQIGFTDWTTLGTGAA